jgi:hypothetical protein
MQTPKNTKMRSIVAAGALALAAMLGSAGASAVYAPPNLIVNGSFEEPTQSSGSWGFHTSMSGWTVKPDADADRGGVEVRNNTVGEAQDGSNFIELDAYGNSWISQTVDTIENSLYQLTFWYSPRENVAADTNGIEVFWNDTSLGTLTGSGAGNTGNVWATHTFTVSGAAGSTTALKFAAVGTSDSYGGGLDNVSLTAVPLPPAAILFGSVLGSLALVARKRRAAAATA